MTLQVERDPITGKYILRVDASLYKESNCYAKTWWTVFRGLHGSAGFKADYGTGLHHAMVEHYSGKGAQAARDAAMNFYQQQYIQEQIPGDDFRSTAHLVNCVHQYIEHYQKNGDMLIPITISYIHPLTQKLVEEKLLEKRFAYPYYKTDLTEVLVCGTMDMIATHIGFNKRVIVDTKVTALWEEDKFLHAYRTSPQLMLYRMIHSILWPDEKDVGCMINAVFIKKTNKNSFKRSEVFTFNDRTMHAFKHRFDVWLMTVVSKFEAVVRETNPIAPNIAFGPNFTVCDGKFGLCGYALLCLCNTVDEQEMLISTEYQPKPYDPMKFGSAI